MITLIKPEDYSDRRVKRRTFQIMNIASGGDSVSRNFDIIFLGFICINIVALMLETVAEFKAEYGLYFTYFEYFAVSIFTIEYGTRLWTADVNPEFKHKPHPRISQMLSPMGIIDMLAILPFYLQALGVDLRFLRALWLMRVFRMFKLFRYSNALQTFVNVIKSTKEQLIIALTFLFITLLIAASLMFVAEHDAQPLAFSSIPASLWWAVATLTTIGYGDIYPITALGKFLASGISIISLGMIALPAGIIGSAFVDEIQSKKVIKHILDLKAAINDEDICPCCNRKFDNVHSDKT